MPSQKSTTTLAELQEPLTEALRRLIDKGEDRHPWVRVENVPQWPLCFVQFAGSRTTPLVYDCPPLGIYNDRRMLSDAVWIGIEGLTRQGVKPEDELQIIESEDRPRGGIQDLFRRLLGAT